MNPSVPRPGDGGEPPWPPPGTGAGSERDAKSAADCDSWNQQEQSAAEQPTWQIPRRPDTVRFRYPAPDGAGERAAKSGSDQQPWQNAVPLYGRPQHDQPRDDPSRDGPSRFGSSRSTPPDDDDAQPTDPHFDVGGVRAARLPVSKDPPYQAQRRGSHLPPYDEPFGGTPAGPRSQPPGAPWSRTSSTAGGMPIPGPGTPSSADAAAGPVDPPAARRTGPRKLTVTRVAAFRSRQLTTRGVEIFQRAAAADGADRSGLTHLTYAVMGNYAVDAALAVALANTLFFAAATAESTSKVMLYLLITVAPFAVIAPLIGPALDKLQHGRRIALAASSFARALLAVVMALNFDSWILYPCALGMLVLSKSFSLLKAAITPRVLPPDITLVKTNSRLTVFGLIAGGAAGALAAGLSWIFGSTGALFLTAVLSIAGGWLCLRIPSWVESTAGEIPVDGVGPKAKRAFPLSVTTTLWANGTIRLETGFLALFIAFVIKSEYSESSGFTQLLLLGVVGAAAGLGGFVGNGLGARLTLSKPETVSVISLSATAIATFSAVLIPGLGTAAVVGLVGSTASSLAKVCLDSVIQHELPEASRASAFGLSETVLQLSWVFGGVIGLLIGGVWSFGQDSVFSIGFAVITVLLMIGLVQSRLVRTGRSLFPWLDYSSLTRHFRRAGRQPVDGTAAAGRGSRNKTPRAADQPPTATRPGAYGQPSNYGDPTRYGPPAQYAPPTQYGPPAQYAPPTQYGPPAQHAPPTQYGPPAQHAPPTQYGPPAQHAPPTQYGPPAQHAPPTQYGPPAQHAPPTQYGPPAQHAPPTQYPPPTQHCQQAAPKRAESSGGDALTRHQDAPPPSTRTPPRDAGKPRKGTRQ